MLLIGLIVVGTALLLKLTGRPAGPRRSSSRRPPPGCSWRSSSTPASATIVIGLIAADRRRGQPGNQLEIATYILLGGLAGDHRDPARRPAPGLRPGRARGRDRQRPRRRDVRRSSGSHDARGVIELMGASVVVRRGLGGRAVGTFAVLGSLFGILTVFQLLELANPSQPLLRRLLVETPGTYHHSLMVGNLAERAAEAIGADPLLTRVAAYYHDIGKLANPLAFIENQAGGENIHDELDPETSAQILKAARRRRDRHRLQGEAAEGADRVHPAAPRDRDHELLLRPGEGPRGRAVRRAADGRRGEARPRRSTSGSSATPARSRSPARRR